MVFLFASGGTLSIGIVFWILMLIWLVFGGWVNWTPANYRPFGGHLLLWFLLFLIGWEVWGFPIGK